MFLIPSLDGGEWLASSLDGPRAPLNMGLCRLTAGTEAVGERTNLSLWSFESRSSSPRPVTSRNKLRMLMLTEPVLLFKV